MKCPLCEHNKFTEMNSKYKRCLHCGGIVRGKESILSAESERNRYLLHQSSFEDEGYRSFISPILKYTEEHILKGQSVLDYGCGHTPILTQILQNKGYTINGFDPYFANNLELLNQEYDFVICCEVVEHFVNPANEFLKLKKLLKPSGILVIMTHLYDNTIDFKNWYYKNDATHVFIYSESTLSFIESHFSFKNLYIKGRLITLQNE